MWSDYVDVVRSQWTFFAHWWWVELLFFAVVILVLRIGTR